MTYRIHASICLALASLLLSVPVRADEAAKPAASQEKADWKPLFNGKNLDGWKAVEFGGEGEVLVKDGQLILRAGEPLTGATYTMGKQLPTENYEISLEAMRVEGSDFFCALTFPIGKEHASLVCGGWGGGVVGISSINGTDASENETSGYREFKEKKWYKIRVKVTKDQLLAFIDDEKVADVERDGKRFDTRIEVDVNKPLGLATYRTTGALKDLKIRTLKAGK
jgi:hypothetical protein